MVGITDTFHDANDADDTDDACDADDDHGDGDDKGWWRKGLCYTAFIFGCDLVQIEWWV